MGRASKLTDEIMGNLYMHVSVGLTYRDACKIEGIAPKTAYRWEQKGREAKSGKYFEFAQKMERARVNNKKHHLMKIYDAKDWRASQWYLSTVYNDEFGETKNINVNGQLDVTNRIDKPLLDKIIEEEDEYKERDE